MDIYDPIAKALDLPPIQIEQVNLDEIKRNSKVSGVSTFPKHVYGTQDRSFMQTSEYKEKQSFLSKISWNNSAPERKQKAKERVQKHMRKKVYAEGIVFDSLTLCADHYNVCLETIRLWMKKGKDFHYI
jgi:hypothetical protein